MGNFEVSNVSRNRSNKMPLYLQIESLIRNRILTGQLKPGEKLPTEENLMMQFGVSRITIRSAMANLERDSLIRRNPAIGTFVSGNVSFIEKFVINNTLKNILEDARRYRVKVVEIKTSKVGDTRYPGYIRQFFNFADEDLICIFRRVRFLNGLPVCFLENYLPVEIGKKLTRAELSKSMMLEAVKKKTDCVVERGDMYISAVPAEPDIAKFLDLQIFEPLILRQIYYWFSDERPFEMVLYYMRSDHFMYKAEMVVKGAY